MALNTLTQVNDAILKELDKMLKAFKLLEEAEIASEKDVLKQEKELEEFAAAHDEFLQRHPNYDEVLKKDKTISAEQIVLRLRVLKMIKDEYGPLIVLRTLVANEQKYSEEAEIPEANKKFEYNTGNRDTGYTGLEISLGKEKAYFTNLGDDPTRQGFRTELLSHGTNITGLKNFLLTNFKEEKYAGNPVHDDGASFWVAKDVFKAKYNNGDIQFHDARRTGVEFKNWDDLDTVKRFAQNRLAKFIKKGGQKDVLQRVKTEAAAIQAAEERIVQDAEAQKKIGEFVANRIKPEAEQVETALKGEIPDKYLGVFRELSTPKNLKAVVDRAKKLDKPVLDILKEEVKLVCRKKDPNCPDDVITVIIGKLGDELKELIQVLAGEQNPVKVISAAITEASSELNKLVLSQIISIGGFNSIKNRKIRKMVKKIAGIKTSLASSQLKPEEMKQLIQEFNSRIVEPVVKYFKDKGFNDEAIAAMQKKNNLARIG